MRTPLFLYRLRKRLRRSDLALPLLLLAVVLIAGAGLFVLAGRNRLPPGPTSPPAPAVAAEAVFAPPRPSAEKLDVRMEAAAAQEMREQAGADLASLPAFELPPPLRSVDGTGFRRGEETIRLDRIEGPGAGDICQDGPQRWSCGLQARAALHNLVAGRSLFCQPRHALPGGGMGADCRLDASGALPAGDVAHLLVRRGWARPAPGSEPEFASEADQAQAEGAGLWRGGWRVFTP